MELWLVFIQNRAFEEWNIPNKYNSKSIWRKKILWRDFYLNIVIHNIFGRINQIVVLVILFMDQILV